MWFCSRNFNYCKFVYAGVMKYIKLDHLTELNIISNQLSKEKMLRSIVLVALAGAVSAIQLDTEQCCNSMVMSCCGNDSDDG